MKIRLNKIILMGNGFDISHGLKTRYQDFILYYLLNCLDKTKQKDLPDVYEFEDDCIKIHWNSRFFRDGLKDVKEYITNSFTSGTGLGNIVIRHKTRKSNYINIDLEIIAKNDFILSILRECLYSDWGGIEDSIYSFLKQSHINLKGFRDDISISKANSAAYKAERSNIQNLNSSVDCLKQNLIYYLKTQNSPTTFNQHLFDSRMEWGAIYDYSILSDDNYLRDVLFLNFNYTTYYLSENNYTYIIDTFSDISTSYEFINIHGDIDDSIDDIIFGVGDEQDSMYSEIETLYDNEWLKNMKSFHYFRKDYYQQVLGFIAKGDYEIFVIGHSCSITDRTLLNMLFENDSCKKIHVYHYQGMNSYLNTTYNIARNFKNKVKLREVLMPYNPNLNMNP
ncbi:AbiH family protein [Sphingobacterium spiritivorum]|uniref:AbiH family protein n=1 Tax=Sphingobacterium spiritivorum TaxID=258 RepID=UPI003DA4F9CF